MQNTYERSINEASKHAALYEADRRDIEAFFEGNKGEDLNALIARVSGAVKNVRKDVAAAVGVSDTTYVKIEDIISSSKQVRSGGVPRSLMAIQNNYLVPENALDPLPEIVRKLSYDQVLSDDQRGVLTNMRFSLIEAKDLLEHAYDQAHLPGSTFSHDTAIMAGAAIEIIDQQLLPAMNEQRGGDAFLERMTHFASREQYHERSSNELYKNALSELATAPEPVKKNGGFAASVGKSAALLAAGAGIGGLGVEGLHQARILKDPAPHVEEYNGPAQQSILKEGAKTPAQRGDQNSVDTLMP